MRAGLISITIAVVMSIGCVAHGQGLQYRSPAARNLEFNGTRLSSAGFSQLARLEAHYRVQLPDGRYWYDRKSGVIGKWGGPAIGFIPAGLSLGGKLPMRASNSYLRVHINGRAIHRQEYAWFTRLFGRAPAPGQYWLDGRGNIGKVGVRGSINLVALARRRARTTGRRGRGKNWSIYKPGLGGNPRGSIGVAGDGKTTCVNTAGYTRCY